MKGVGNIPRDQFNHDLDSLKPRLKRVIEVNGGHIKINIKARGWIPILFLGDFQKSSYLISY